MEKFRQEMHETQDFNEASRPNADADKAMTAFAIGLAKLSKKTGITVETTGGLYYDDPKTIKSVTYSDDFSSGDLSCDLVEK